MLLKSIPVIDLFAGPGGLSEGFSSLLGYSGHPVFDVRVSIEKDPQAYETLKLRSFFRAFPKGRVPDCYYDYIRGDIPKHELRTSELVREEWQLAEHEAHNATLGETSPDDIDGWIREAIGNSDTWVLIGGPPCQAYSFVGRSRMRNGDPHAFEKDKRHFLYKEYLRIIQKFQPTVFVMENVKGMLSSTHGGSPIFGKIREDLSRPAEDLEYEIRSFVRQNGELKPTDFVIESENYGIPQRRHRVILFGIRRSHGHGYHRPLVSGKRVTVQETLSCMPKVRSRLSPKFKPKDSFENWLDVLRNTRHSLGRLDPCLSAIVERIDHATQQAESVVSTGSRFISCSCWSDASMPPELANSIRDPKLGGVCQHETRSHMPSDLHRYMFAACYAEIHGVSPKLRHFPLALWPEHRNVDGSERTSEVPFDDRFRVQCWGSPSTTVLSHMAKDGHYFIHPDPIQCRSLTVREAACLQTFPDNYFFEGNKIDQYTQVGNAVPPHLARQIAEIVADFLAEAHQAGHVSTRTVRGAEQMEELLETQ